MLKKNQILLFLIIILTGLIGCSAPSIPDFETPNFESSNFSLGIIPFEDQSHLTKGNKIPIDINGFNEAIKIIAYDSKAFNSVSIINENISDSEFKTDYILKGKYYGIVYSEHPTVGTFLHPYNLLSELILLGGIGVIAAGDLSPLGEIMIGIGSLGFIVNTFLYKTLYGHDYNIKIYYELIDNKSKSIISSKTLEYEYSDTYSHTEEEVLGETWSGPIKTIHSRITTYNVDAIKSYHSSFTVMVAIEKMLDDVTKKLKIKKLEDFENEEK